MGQIFSKQISVLQVRVQEAYGKVNRNISSSHTQKDLLPKLWSHGGHGGAPEETKAPDWVAAALLGRGQGPH